MRGQSKRYLIYSERVPLIHLLFFEAMNSFFYSLDPRYFCHFTTLPRSRACLGECHISAPLFNVEAKKGMERALCTEPTQVVI